MSKGVVTLALSANAMDVAKVLKKHQIGCVVLADKSKAMGIVTERDIAYKVVASGKDPKKVKVTDIMSAPLKVISASTSLDEAALLMKTHKIKRLPVVDKQDKLVGIITEDDMLRIYPGYVDLARELSELKTYGDEPMVVTGMCDKCGSYSETLIKSFGKLLCEECREEEEA